MAASSSDAAAAAAAAASSAKEPVDLTNEQEEQEEKLVNEVRGWGKGPWLVWLCLGFPAGGFFRGGGPGDG